MSDLNERRNSVEVIEAARAYIQAGKRGEDLQGALACAVDAVFSARRAPAAAPAPVAASNLPKWIDSQKGRCPETDALIEYIEKLHAAAAPIVQPLGDPLAKDTGARLRAICGLLGLKDAVPDTDEGVWDVAFCVLGMVRREVEKLQRAALAAPVVQAEPVENGTIVGGHVMHNQVVVEMDGQPSTDMWTVGNRCYLYLTAPTTAAADAKDAARYRCRKQFLENGGAIVWTFNICQFRKAGELIATGTSEEECIDEVMGRAAIATSADEVKS